MAWLSYRGCSEARRISFLLPTFFPSFLPLQGERKMEEEGRAEKQCGSLRYSTLSSRGFKSGGRRKGSDSVKGYLPQSAIHPNTTCYYNFESSPTYSTTQTYIWLAVVGAPCAVKHVYCIFDGRAPKFERKSLPYLGPRDA